MARRLNAKTIGHDLRSRQTVVDRKADEAEFVALFEAAPNGIIAIDAVGLILQANAEAERIFGYARGELIGRSVEVLVPERLRRSHTRLRDGFIALPRVRPMGVGRELLALRKDGSEFPVEIGLNWTVIGTIETVVAAVVDISERKRADGRAHLADRARTVAELFQQLGRPAAVVESGGRLLSMNLSFSKFQAQFEFTGDKVEFSNAKANEFFRQALASLDSGREAGIISRIMVSSEGRHPSLIVHLLRLRNAADDLFCQPIGVLVVATHAGRETPPPELLRALFALTPAEARVAAAIGTGLSPRQAAERLGISEGTARTTLKTVFGKVGVGRQSELVALFDELILH